jgi:hypothetical protein
MKYYLKLHQHFVSCPSCWRGFIDSLDREESPEKDHGGYTTAFIDKHLKPYNANYIETDWTTIFDDYVRFETEADAIVFKLKYGSNS